MRMCVLVLGMLLMSLENGLQAQQPEQPSPSSASAATKRRQAEEDVVKTFYFSKLSQPTDLQDVLNALHTVVEISRIQLLPSQDAIVVRATPDQLALAEKMIGDIDTGRPAASAYHVVIQLIELENDKRINARSYDFTARPEQNMNLRNGLRVPVAGTREQTSSGGKAGETPSYSSEGPQYADVGLHMQARLREHGERFVMPEGAVGLDFDLELTSLPKEEQITGQAPVLRVTSQRVDSMVTLDKPTIIASLDEVDSNRRMQVEATITKVKF